MFKITRFLWAKWKHDWYKKVIQFHLQIVGRCQKRSCNNKNVETKMGSSVKRKIIKNDSLQKRIGPLNRTFFDLVATKSIE